MTAGDRPARTPPPAQLPSARPATLDELERCAIRGEVTDAHALATLRALLVEHVPEVVSEVLPRGFYEGRLATLAPRRGRGLAILAQLAVSTALEQEGPAVKAALSRFATALRGACLRMEAQDRASQPSMPALRLPAPPENSALSLRGAAPDQIAAALRDYLRWASPTDQASLVALLGEIR